MSVSISYLPKPFDDLAKIWCLDLSTRSLEIKAKETQIIVRLSLVACQFFLCYRAQFSLSAVASIGLVFSLPSTTLFLGIYLIGLAYKEVYENVLLAGAYVAISWLCLSIHEERAWGFLERTLPGLHPSPPPMKNVTPEQEWIEGDVYTPPISQEILIERLKTDWKAKGKFTELQEEEEIASGIFCYKILASKLGSDDVIEFFYCYEDIRLNQGNAFRQGRQMTGKNRQQVFYGCFSNTLSKPFFCDGFKWASREHYIQAMRFKIGSTIYSLIKEAKSPFSTPQGLLKEVAKSEHAQDLRGGNWEEESFYIVMHANFAYFAQHKEARQNLLATENMPLVQRNDKHDIWGISYRNGMTQLNDEKGSPVNRNRQGWILMYLRNYFRN